MTTSKLHLGGMTNTTLHFQSDGSVIAEEYQDSQAILDANQRKRNERFCSGGDFQEAYDIPAVLFIRWQRECGEPMGSKAHMAYVDKRLKDPEFASLRTAPTLRDPHVIVRGPR